MPGRLRPRLTYANVMATVAVFVALGGSSYAVTLGKNSVKSKHIAKGQVKRSDIGRNAVDSSKIANGKLRAADFAPGQLPKGDKGDAGPSSGPATASVRVGGLLTAGANGSGPGCVDGVPGGSKGFRDAANLLVNGGCGGGAGGSAETTVSCQAGEFATGGGYTYQSGKRHALVTENAPSPASAGQTPTGWHIKVETLTNDGSNDTPVTPYVVCARP